MTDREDALAKAREALSACLNDTPGWPARCLEAIQRIASISAPPQVPLCECPNGCEKEWAGEPDFLHGRRCRLSAPSSQSESDDEKLIEAMANEFVGHIAAGRSSHVAMRFTLAVARKALTPSPTPYVWRDMKYVPKDQDVILYFSLGSCRVPLVARYEPGFLDPIGLEGWRVTQPIPGEAPTGWLPIIWKD